jgi:phosphoserine phosphatase RsbU/P
MTSEMLRQFPLFTNLPAGEIDHLARTLEEYRFQPGEIVFSEGSLTEYFYMILEGEVEIVKSLATPDERVLAVNHRGAVLGEMSMFSRNGTHTASARAYTPLKLLKISFEKFDEILRRHPELTYSLLRLYSSRLEESESLTIQDLREKNRQLTLAYQELQAAQAAMIEKERLERELQLAAEIQVGILPEEHPILPGLEFGALMVPARLVGGDFYDFIVLDDQRVAIVVGDVCDKGMPAALFMALTYSLVRAEAFHNIQPGNVLRAVNRHLLQTNRSNMFVTLLYGVLDCSTYKFTYARAGHPQPLILDGANRPAAMTSPNGQPTGLRIGQPIGLFEAPAIDESTISIPEGGTLLVYSDGLSETVDTIQDSPALPDLCSSVMQAQPLDAQGLCDHLWEMLGGCTDETLIQDDFTVVAVRRLC